MEGKIIKHFWKKPHTIVVVAGRETNMEKINSDNNCQRPEGRVRDYDQTDLSCFVNVRLPGERQRVRGLPGPPFPGF